MLRVYDLAATPASTVRVQYFSMDSDQLLLDHVLPLQVLRSELPFWPGYGEVAQLANTSQLDGLDRFRIRVIRGDPSQRLWAMVSVTNNVTQELTIISPQ